MDKTQPDQPPFKRCLLGLMTGHGNRLAHELATLRSALEVSDLNDFDLVLMVQTILSDISRVSGQIEFANVIALGKAPPAATKAPPPEPPSGPWKPPYTTPN